MKSVFLGALCETQAIVALGKDACSKFKGLPKGFVFTDENFSFDGTSKELRTPSDVVELLNGFVSFAPLTGGETRSPNTPLIMPYYPSIVTLETEGGDPRINQEGFGSGVPNGINPYSETYTITDGGDCMYKQLAKLENRLMRVFRIDENDIMYGTVDKNGNIKGYKCYISVTPRENTGDTVGANLLLITYQNSYKQERVNEVAVALEEELQTLRQVAVAVPRDVTEGFRIVTECTGSSITKGNKALADVFVANPEVFIADGAPLQATVTVAYVEATDTFTLTKTGGGDIELALAEDMYNVGEEQVEEFKYFLGNENTTTVTAKQGA